MPVPPGMPDVAVTPRDPRARTVFYLHGFLSSGKSTKAAYNEERLLDFGFYEDTVRYDAFEASVSQPTLIFQGVRDRSVDHRTVEQFARTRPNVTLSLLDDDHQLVASLPRIWNDLEAFLGLVE